MEVLFDQVRARRAAAGGKTIASIIEITGQPALEQRLERDPAVEAVFVTAVDAAVRSGLEAKRRLLARAVADAVMDEAKLDESYVLTSILAELDVPHVRTLKALGDEWAVAQETPVEGVSWGISKVWASTPSPIRAALIRTGTAIPATSNFHAKGEPNRQEGISDYGLEVLKQLLEEGYAAEGSDPRPQ